jgi:signal transduction histidine kinase
MEDLPSSTGRHDDVLSSPDLEGTVMDHTQPQHDGVPSRAPVLDAADHYAAVVLHDLHNPLEAASNLTYLIQAEAENADSVRRYAQLIEEQLSTISGIAREALSFYKHSRKALDLVGVTEAALRIYGAKIGGKDLHIRRKLPKHAFVDAHAGEMLQLLSNLLANAIDALPAGATLSVRITRCKSEIHIAVADNGHGIPAKILSQVFDPFFTTKSDLGTGLGLAISKSIVRRHDGKIRVRSCREPERAGTIFRISLPVKSVDLRQGASIEAGSLAGGSSSGDASRAIG